MNRLKRAVIESAVAGVELVEVGTATRRFCFASDFLGFSGHFPGYAILPAIVQIMTALTVAEELTGESLELVAIRNAKFHRELRPGQEIVVWCRQRLIEGKRGCEARLTAFGELASSFLMQFADKGGCNA